MREWTMDKTLQRYVNFMERNVRQRFGIGPVPLMVISAFGFGFSLGIFIMGLMGFHQ